MEAREWANESWARESHVGSAEKRCLTSMGRPDDSGARKVELENGNKPSSGGGALVETRGYLLAGVGKMQNRSLEWRQSPAYIVAKRYIAPKFHLKNITSSSPVFWELFTTSPLQRPPSPEHTGVIWLYPAIAYWDSYYMYIYIYIYIYISGVSCSRACVSARVRFSGARSAEDFCSPAGRLLCKSM